MMIIPFQPEVLKDILVNQQHTVIDLEGSKLDGKTSIIYLTNLQIQFSFDPNCDKAKKFAAFKEFLVSKYKTNSVQLIETSIRMLSRYHGRDLGEGPVIPRGPATVCPWTPASIPSFMSAEEIDEFIIDNKEMVDEIVEYYNSMPYTMISMVDQYKKHLIDPLIESGGLVVKKDDKIGINVIKLAGLPDFVEEYLTWPESLNNTIMFDHSTKAGEHVHKLIASRPENSTVALIYALANNKLSSDLKLV